MRQGHRTIGRVLDGHDDAGSEHKLLPGLANVDDVDAILAAAPDVLGHHEIRVLGADVHLGGEHLLDVWEDGGGGGGGEVRRNIKKMVVGRAC